MLFGSLPAAMFIFSSLIGALGKAKVLPSILEAPAGEADNGRVTIAAILVCVSLSGLFFMLTNHAGERRPYRWSM